MKQLLPELKKLNSHLSFLKKCTTKRGFRHAQAYVGGLIAINHKTIRQISKAAISQESESSLKRLLNTARFRQEVLEERYIKKISYLVKGQETNLIFDDTLVKREGKKVEEAQRHKNHSGEAEYITGHQFFTSMITTPYLELPLLPKLYSKNTESKIQMAQELIDFVVDNMDIDNVLFDSWYSDKKLIKKCMTRQIRVVCVIKTNRKVSLTPGQWQPLSEFSKKLSRKTFEPYIIDEADYHVASHLVKLNGIPFVKMVTSKKKEKHRYKKPVHLISTHTNDTPAQIIRRYEHRWAIETYHRDIKQNLGFGKLFLRKKEGIVRHSILSTLAYAILKLYMLARGMTHTIGDCIAHIQNQEMDNFVREIIEIDDKKTRINLFETTFKRETVQV